MLIFLIFTQSLLTEFVFCQNLLSYLGKLQIDKQKGQKNRLADSCRQKKIVLFRTLQKMSQKQYKQNLKM